MMRWTKVILGFGLGAMGALADVGDPQIMTLHPWYPGELALSSFDRLAKTQARVYERVTGKKVDTDQDKALAAWLWRNTHFAHGEEGKGDYFDTGFEKSDWNREYWHGMFAHGFALCGTTHAQWTAEMEHLLGPCRGRAVGVSGHNSFEVWLTGGAYGDGRWALLDHDVSTVVFDESGSRLLGIREVKDNLKTYKDPYYKPERQHGWRVAGLHDGDAGAFDSYRVAEYRSGYAGPQPLVHLRRGETLTRHHQPGLADGKTYVFWGRNYQADGIPGPSRDRSWVNQPDKMYQSKKGTGWVASRVRYANAVYQYQPDFATDGWKEGVVDAGDEHVTFEFYTPYIIAATPPDDSDWGIYKDGGKNGLVVEGKAACEISLSTDCGQTWNTGGALKGKIDLTDHVKGHQQYWIRLGTSAAKLKDSGLTMTTVCQANVAVLPRLTDGMNRVAYMASGRGLVSAGPNQDQAMAHLIDGELGNSGATLELKAPRGEAITGIAAVSWNRSGAPPQPVKWRIETSSDDGSSWEGLVEDDQIIRRGDEPGDFWSQSFTYGEKGLPGVKGPVRVRFSNDSRKGYRKVEAHAYYAAGTDPLEVRFAWRNGADGALRTAEHRYGDGEKDATWGFDAGVDVETVSVMYRCR
jgi:hypothetical protein